MGIKTQQANTHYNKNMASKHHHGMEQISNIILVGLD